MSTLSRFTSYAAAFEETYADDDWGRLEPFFVEDAVYQVSGLAAPCVLRGRDAIFRGIKKSLDGFDRKLDGRKIIPTGPPEASGDRLTLHGMVRYRKAGAPDLELHATIVVEFEGDRIRHMHDAFRTDDREAAAWFASHGAGLDAAYV